MKAPSVADQLVSQAARKFELFHDPTREAWAWDIASREAFLVGSDSFAERLVRDHYQSKKRVPTQSAITQAVQALRGLAVFDGPEHPVFVRKGSTSDGRIVLDLTGAPNRVIVISPNGWEIAEEPPVRFWRPEGMLALPDPVRGGDLDALLAEVLGIDDESSLVLLQGWLLSCLSPAGSKPVLMLSGEQGSGKSERARMLRGIIDPNAVPLRTMPTDERDLAIMARRALVNGFDNVSFVSDELSDALCRLSTGGGFSTRKLFTDQDEVLFQAVRPVVLTSIPEVDRQSDLADRSLHVTFDRISDTERRTEEDLRTRFEAAHPEILGALLDATACALANRDRISLPELPRMADLARHVTAAESALGHAEGTFVAVYQRNRDEAASDALEGTLVGRYLEEVAREGFAGTATKLFDRIEQLAGDHQTRRRGWPASPRGLAGTVRRLAPSLAATGYSVEFERAGHDRQRIIRLTFSGHDGPPAKILPLADDQEQTQATAEQIASIMVAAGLSETWTATKAANLALHKSSGNAFLAARALNMLAVPSPDGGTWTAVKIQGVT